MAPGNCCADCEGCKTLRHSMCKQGVHVGPATQEEPSGYRWRSDATEAGAGLGAVATLLLVREVSKVAKEEVGDFESSDESSR